MTPCPLCDGAGWMQAAPVEDSDGLNYRTVRNSFVGTFAPVPCFNCFGGQHV